MISIGLIGCGYWGPNLLRNFNKASSSCVTHVCDLNRDRLAYVTDKYPQTITTKDYQDILDSSLEAVVISTPPSSHYSLAKEALLAGKHVFVEKPLALRSDHAKELVELAHQCQLTLMVGHTFLYNEAVRELKRQIDQHVIGQPYYLYAQRLNYGIVRDDINALWSLAPHDISILLYVLGVHPLRVSARGYDFVQKGIEDVVFIELEFPNQVSAHVQVSWLDPNKVRRMTVVGSKKMIVYDEVDDKMIQVFDKGIAENNKSDSLGAYDDFGRFQQLKSAGDVHFPKIDFVEPLSTQCAHFVDSLINQTSVDTDGVDGYRVVKILESAQASLEKDGVWVDLKFDSFEDLKPNLIAETS